MPVGAGSGVCGAAIVAKSINPRIEVIGVQSAQAPTQQLSWQAGEPVCGPMNTFIDGVATRVPFENTQAIMRQYLDDFVLVDDEDTKRSLRLLIEHTRNLPEGAAGLFTRSCNPTERSVAGEESCHRLLWWQRVAGRSAVRSWRANNVAQSAPISSNLVCW